MTAVLAAAARVALVLGAVTSLFWVAVRPLGVATAAWLLVMFVAAPAAAAGVAALGPRKDG